MSRTGSTFFVRALEDYGVDYLFGNPGTTELPLMDALPDSDIEYVLGLHEDVAVGMASGYAKVRQWHAMDDSSINPLGVVNLHVAPGLAHGLGNVFDSSLIGTCAPLLVTAGWQSTGHQHREPNLYGDLVEMADQFTKWSAEVKDVEAFPDMLRRAVRTALSPPTGPVFLGLPFDVMSAEFDGEPARLGTIPRVGDADDESIDDAADALVDADDPVLVVGDRLPRSGPNAVDATVRLAEAVGARVHGAFRLSEAAFPTDHPQWAGSLPNDREASTALLETDAVAMLGTISNVPTLDRNRPVSAYEGTTLIQVNDDVRELGKNYTADVSVLGHVGRAAAAIADRTEGRVDRAELDRRLEAVASIVEDHRERVEAAAAGPAGPFATRGSLADGLVEGAPDARIVAEATTSVGSLRDRHAFGPGDFFNYRGGGLGYALSASIGMAIAEGQRGDPRPVVGFVGDGSFLYYPNAVYSAVRSNVDVTMVVANNRNYQVLKDKLPGLTGRPAEDHAYLGMELDPGVDLPAIARAQGADAERIDSPDVGAIADAVARAVEADGPRLLDVHIND